MQTQFDSDAENVLIKWHSIMLQQLDYQAPRKIQLVHCLKIKLKGEYEVVHTTYLTNYFTS